MSLQGRKRHGVGFQGSPQGYPSPILRPRSTSPALDPTAFAGFQSTDRSNAYVTSSTQGVRRASARCPLPLKPTSSPSPSQEHIEQTMQSVGSMKSLCTPRSPHAIGYAKSMRPPPMRPPPSPIAAYANNSGPSQLQCTKSVSRSTEQLHRPQLISRRHLVDGVNESAQADVQNAHMQAPVAIGLCATSISQRTEKVHGIDLKSPQAGRRRSGDFTSSLAGNCAINRNAVSSPNVNSEHRQVANKSPSVMYRSVTNLQRVDSINDLQKIQVPVTSQCATPISQRTERAHGIDPQLSQACRGSCNFNISLGNKCATSLKVVSSSNGNSENCQISLESPSVIYRSVQSLHQVDAINELQKIRHSGSLDLLPPQGGQECSEHRHVTSEAFSKTLRTWNESPAENTRAQDDCPSTSGGSTASEDESSMPEVPLESQSVPKLAVGDEGLASSAIKEAIEAFTIWCSYLEHLPSYDHLSPETKSKLQRLGNLVSTMTGTPTEEACVMLWERVETSVRKHAKVFAHMENAVV